MQDWLAFGQADVAVQLARFGYGTAAPTNTVGLTWVEKMNCLRACMNVEMTYPITEWGQNNERMNMFEKQWDEGIALLESGRLGDILDDGSEADTALSDGLAITGTSYARKLSREEDTDRVAGRFVRGFGQSTRTMKSRGYDPNSS